MWLSDVAREALLIANIYRITILALLMRASENPGLTWSKIKSRFDNSPRQEFHMNPNTLRYHLNKLMDAGLVEKKTEKGRKVYRITRKGKDILKKYEINEKIIDAIIDYLDGNASGSVFR